MEDQFRERIERVRRSQMQIDFVVRHLVMLARPFRSRVQQWRDDLMQGTAAPLIAFHTALAKARLGG